MARVSIGMLVLGATLLMLVPVVGALVMTAGGFGLALRLEDGLAAPADEPDIPGAADRPAGRGRLHRVA